MTEEEYRSFVQSAFNKFLAGCLYQSATLRTLDEIYDMIGLQIKQHPDAQKLWDYPRVDDTDDD